MRALVLTDWHQMSVEEVADPTTSPGHALVEVRAVGICGSDIHGYTGENGRRHIGQVMGHEAAGIVLSVGEPRGDSSHVRPGDLVAINPVLSCGACPRCQQGRQQNCGHLTVFGVDPRHYAAFAELTVVREENLVVMASEVPARHAALVEPLAVGYHAFQQSDMAGAHNVVIFGAGPIGQACVIAAIRHQVPHIVVVEPNPQRREIVEALGACTVDPSRPSEVGLDVLEAAGGPLELIIDTVGTSETVETALSCLVPAGQLTLVGMAATDLRLQAYAITTAERTLRGSFCYSRADFQATAAWVASTSVDLDVLVSSEIALGDAPAAFKEGVTSPRAAKVIVNPQR